MKSCTNRPEVSVIDGTVWVFVGGTYQTMSLQAAKVLRAKLDEAILALEDTEDET